MKKDYNIENYKKSFAEYATGVALVVMGNTIVNNKENTSDKIKYGLTINSLASLSLEPTLTSWNLGKSNYCLKELLVMKFYVIHLLSTKHLDIAKKFSGKSSIQERNRLLLSWKQDKDGSPLLKDARVTLFCKQLEVIEKGDHYLMIGKVIQSIQPQKNDSPLLYYRGKYGAFQAL